MSPITGSCGPETDVRVDIKKLFHRVVVDEGKMGMIPLLERDVSSIERFVCERFRGVKNSARIQKALEEYIYTRIRFWASKAGYLDMRVSIWDLEEAKSHLINAGAQKHAVTSLEQKFGSLIKNLKE